MLRLIEPSSWVAQPWKNGAGTTHELVRIPATAAYAVRISVAEITAPAPFSAFAGYKRWLYLLDGGPVTLSIDGTDTVLTAEGDGVSFAGDTNVAATAVARPSRDLNLMVATAHSVRCDIVRGPATESRKGSAVAVFVIAGTVTASGHVLGRHACAWGTDERLELEVGPDAIAAVISVDR